MIMYLSQLKFPGNNTLYFRLFDFLHCQQEPDRMAGFSGVKLGFVTMTVILCLLGQENKHQQLGPHREYAINNALTLVNHHNVGSDLSLSTLHSIFSRDGSLFIDLENPFSMEIINSGWHIWVYSAFYAVAMYLWTQVQQDIHVRLAPNP